MTTTRHVAGSTFEDGQAGKVYTEICKATVAGAGFNEAANNALNDAQMPQRYDSLVFGVSPDDFTLTCDTRRVTRMSQLSDGTALVTVEVVWRSSSFIITTTIPNDDGAGVTTIGAVTEVVETEFDRSGVEITVKRNATSANLIQPVQFRRPFPVIEFSRYEVNSPRTRAQTYVGLLNSGAWNGYSDQTVLCTSIVGTTRDGGQSYDVRYAFEYRAGGWAATVVYVDEDTGRPISGLVEGVSKKTDIELYSSISFAGLNISL